MNFALVPNVLLLLKGCREGEAFYHAPVDLGFQLIKLLALEPFEVKHQCCPNPIERQVCVFSGGDTLAHIGGINIDIQNLVPQLVQILSGENQVARSAASAKSSRGYHPFALSDLTHFRSVPLYGESG